MNAVRAALENPVAGNLLIVGVILFGLSAFFGLPREVMPEFTLDAVTVTVPYRGATPDEVEESVVTKIEETLAGVEGVKEIRSVSSEGIGVVTVDVLDGYDTMLVKEDVEKEVQQIPTLPLDSERPVIVRMTRKIPAIYLGLYGDADPETLKRAAERVRDDLIGRGVATLVEFTGLKPREISVELSEAALSAHGISFRQAADALRRESIDLPSGTIKSPQGELLVRTAARRYTGEELGRIPLIADRDGAVVPLGAVARITDGFEDANRFSLLNGRPAVLLRVSKTDGQDLVRICEGVKAYAAEMSGKIEGGLSLATWSDSSSVVRDRLDLLTRNGAQGLVLVFLFLVLFMEFKLAFWVALGIPFCFMGTFLIMSWLGLTLNMISMFALIIVLGIVVDDAMVVSDSIHSRLKRGMAPEAAALQGTVSVFWPVIASVSTTVVAFVPFFFVTGMMGKFMAILPTAVISVLLLSLVESLFILPAHLAHSARGRRLNLGPLGRLQAVTRGALERVVTGTYPTLLRKALRARYLTLALAVASLVVSAALVAGGRVQFTFFPNTDQELLRVTLELPAGTDAFRTLAELRRMEEELFTVQREFLAPDAAGRRRAKGPFVLNIHHDVGSEHSGKGVMTVELENAERRSLYYLDIVNAWRTRIGEIPDALSLAIQGMNMGPGGQAVELQLRGDDLGELAAARDEVRRRMTEYPFIVDLADNLRPGKLEARVRLTDEGRALGFRAADLAAQVRQAFYGEEPLRIQRGRDDIRVFVRHGKAERDALATLATLRVRNPAGEELPFSRVASFDYARGFTAIHHAFRQKQATVTADIDGRRANDSLFRARFDRDVLPELRNRFPGVTMEFRGRATETADSMRSLFAGLVVALGAIYIILATVFGAYIQPVIIMAAIPLGAVGVVFGHLLLRFDLTMLSLFGFVALSGMVVNNSLLIIDFANRRRAERPDEDKVESCVAASAERFTAIFLTTATTFLGVTPMLLEKSRQAVFLQPMVVSLGMGIVFATALTLFVVPALYLILDDATALLRGSAVAPAADAAAPAATGAV